MLFLGPEEEYPDCHGVGGKAHSKHDDVDDWEEDGCKTTAKDFSALGADPNPIAGLCTRKASQFFIFWKCKDQSINRLVGRKLTAYLF